MKTKNEKLKKKVKRNDQETLKRTIPRRVGWYGGVEERFKKEGTYV